MKLWGRIKNVFTNEYTSYVKAFLSGDELPKEGKTISKEAALTYSAVFACCRVLSETVASLPIKIYKKDKDGNKEYATKHPLNTLLHNKPNEEMSPYAFKEAVMMSLCLSGNAYIQKVKDRLGRTVSLWPIDADNVIVLRDKETMQLKYVIKDGTSESTYTRSEIMHISGLSLNGITGLTPIGYISKAIELGLTYENFGVNFYKNGANPSGILEHPGVLQQAALERLREQFTKKYIGLANTGKPLILEDGMKYVQLTVKQSDAQFLESRKFQIEDICRIYRVPLHLVQNLDRATNNNIEHQSLEFVTYTMLPWFVRIEEAISCQLLSDAEVAEGYYAEFLVDSLLRGDSQTRAAAYAVARNWGWMSVNEIRQKENMNRIENGDIYLQPLNMAEAGEEPEPEPEPEAEDEAPTDDENEGNKPTDDSENKRNIMKKQKRGGA